MASDTPKNLTTILSPLAGASENTKVLPDAVYAKPEPSSWTTLPIVTNNCDPSVTF